MPEPSTTEPHAPPADERLGSWKAIAAYVKRDVTTVQRWERREGMPVHRHLHDKRGSVYAFRSELDTWLSQRSLRTEPGPVSRLGHRAVAAGLLMALAAAAATAWWATRAPERPGNALAGARITPLTDFPGLEEAAALSPDGRFVAFVSDRDGTPDIWVTQVGTAEFRNLTKGAAGELINPEVRSVAFTPDGSLVTFWARTPGTGEPINVWSVPAIGGPLRIFRSGAVEMAWSSDGSRVVFHTAASGDPMFLESAGAPPRPVYVAPQGLHNHFQVWSARDEFIYFVRGVPPDDLDIWRVEPDGSGLERITNHGTRVLYPTFLDERTLLYLATADDGSGPWLYAIDVERRVPRRISFGVEQYSSLAGSGDRQRFVVTVEHSRSSLWRVSIGDAIIDESAAQRITLPTLGGFSPRASRDFLLYVVARNQGHGIWKLTGDHATEIWSAARTRVLGAPAIAPDGRRIAFAAEDDRGIHLYVMNSDRPGTHTIATPLAVRSNPAWSPDGQSLTVALEVEGAPRLHRVPLDGGAPVRLVDGYSTNPTWSPDGELLVYAAADEGPDFPLRAVRTDGTAHSLPEIRIPRGSRRVAFVPGGRTLIVLLGEMRRGNFFLVDLDTGARRQLTSFGREFTTRDFDVTPDGTELVFDRREDNANLALIEVAGRASP